MEHVHIIARQTLVEAYRHRLFWTTLALAVGGLFIGWFFQSLAIAESEQIHSAVVASLSRVGAVVLLTLYVVSSISRDFNDRMVQIIFSLPVTRMEYFFGKLLGFSIVASLVALLFGLSLVFFGPKSGIFAWTVSLACELVLVSAVAMLFALSLNQISVAVLATMAFYVLARAIRAMVLMAGSETGLISSWSQKVIELSVNMLAYMLPRLSRYTNTEWVVYQPPEFTDMLYVILQTAFFVSLISAAALIDLYRKNI